jgi:anti-anti-sigma regulatory factor
MPTSITQIENPETGGTVLRVEGSLTLEDAELLEKVALEMLREDNMSLSIDLADITFLDSDGGSVLSRLKARGVALEGIHYFVQKEIEVAEQADVARANNSRRL